jgi:hypothetical protein
MKCWKTMIEEWQSIELVMDNCGVWCGGMRSDRLYAEA